MKPLTGGLVGALLTGLAVFGWHARPGAEAEPAWVGARTAPSAVQLVSDTGPATAPLEPASNAPLSVQCEPGQRAVLRQVPAWNGTVSNEAACVGQPETYASSAFVAPGVIDPVRARPVQYVSNERVVPERVVYRERPVRRVQSQRTWKQRALVIGGSAGAGAGIGALAGGKRGALIGAAIGGGAGTVYELMKK